MAVHKYGVGQDVYLRPNRLSSTLSRYYKIVRRLPIEEGSIRYRIKATDGSEERVVQERDLSPVRN
jgi:hypothetical protein